MSRNMSVEEALEVYEGIDDTVFEKKPRKPLERISGSRANRMYIKNDFRLVSVWRPVDLQAQEQLKSDIVCADESINDRCIQRTKNLRVSYLTSSMAKF